MKTKPKVLKIIGIVLLSIIGIIGILILRSFKFITPSYENTPEIVFIERTTGGIAGVNVVDYATKDGDWYYAGRVHVTSDKLYEYLLEDIKNNTPYKHEDITKDVMSINLHKSEYIEHEGDFYVCDDMTTSYYIIQSGQNMVEIYYSSMSGDSGYFLNAAANKLIHKVNSMSEKGMILK